MRKFTALAAGVLVAGAAELSGAASADPIDWEAIALCESGGNWSAATGAGYGGLQISAADWDANGVGLPSQATRQQQIVVAKRIMAARGPGAWAGCVSRGSTAAGAPVGSLTHYVTTLYADTPGTGAPTD
ncbi:resuscitation-promoting factor-like protein [Mycolicibacter nonchromogenicus]|uniref:Resuscitation-promoting factor-like protein n=2 Tax=Mycolicibacter TaxID=1073531 RepID=A0A1X1TE62_9MYCO|nr:MULTISPECIES: transglycosylase family protein [Mycolicibacter]ORV42831.1 resuscitation-promoting factor-like protein [Mycolicibacter engbaekii]ORW16631.1 resuscitation-promoting factor-like protein [Mycolicibacter nonchromogenicus]